MSNEVVVTIVEPDMLANGDGKKRILRTHGRFQMVRFIRAFGEYIAADPAQFVQSCVTCDLFDEKAEKCKPANARPPARVIAFGCEKFSNLDDDIPF